MLISESQLIERSKGSLHSLLGGLIDYAGLFPPAKLGMREAVHEYARVWSSDQRWMLGRFVVPMGRMNELEAEAAPWLADEQVLRPWPLSVLVADGSDDTVRQLASVRQRQDDAGHLRVEALEVKVSSPQQVGELARVYGDLEVFCEIANDQDPRPYLAAVAEHAAAESEGHGARGKIRTGSVVASEIPDIATVARFLAAAAAVAAPFKATAGLHHPLRGSYPLTYEKNSPRGEMHGFLNLFLASAFLREGLVDEAGARQILAETEAEAFTLDLDTLSWRGLTMPSSALARSRDSLALSFGSCSFSEPTEEIGHHYGPT